MVLFRTRIYGSGGEQFITIGYFHDTLFIDSLNLNYAPECCAYFFIDNVWIIDNQISEASTNIFTPNGDGINDLFIVKGLQPTDKVLIYNRWGTKVYEFAGINDAWDGRTTSGEECSDGVYFYIIMRNEQENVKSFFQLLR